MQGAASGSEVTDYFAHNTARMERQEENLAATGRAVQALVAQVSGLTQQIQQLTQPIAPNPPPVPPAPPAPARQHEPRLPTPESYSGEPSYCRAFLTKCSMFFALQPQTFCTEDSKVAFVLTLLSGRAALWGTVVWENHRSCCDSFAALSEEMKRVFDRAVAGREAARQLADIRQGERSVADYSIEFRTLSTECRWNEEAQWDIFLHGLADRIQREIYTLDLPGRLDDLIELALRVDARLHRLELHTRTTPTQRSFGIPPLNARDAVSPVDDHEPMQVGRARLSREERERRRSRGLCLYCGGAGHFLNNCPVKERARQ